MKSIYLFCPWTVKGDAKLIIPGIASFVADVLVFPKRSMYAAALRGLVLSPFMAGPPRVRFIMKRVTLEDPGQVFLDTDVVVREGVLIRGRLDVGARTYIAQGSIFVGPVTIGSDVNMNYRCEVYAQTAIGDRCSIGPGVKFLSTAHEMGSEDFRAGNFFSKPIRVGDGAWIGGYSVVLGGVTIGKGAVVGAGSLVTKDVPDNTLALGHPAKVVKKLGPGYGGGPPGSPKRPEKIRWA
jgi:UDP-3-O-[3-hydroxymyristoyl] glucosamine N-acyltransferase